MLIHLKFSLSREWSVVGERIFNLLLNISQLQGTTNINSVVQDEQMQRIKPNEKLKRKDNLLSMIGHEHD
jgi:hypothetical protein